MEKMEDYLVETTIDEIKDGRPIRVYYQGNGNVTDKKVSLMRNPLFSKPIDGEVEAPVIYNNSAHYHYYGAYKFSPNPVHPMVPIRFDRKDTIACDIYINIDNCDSDSGSFNINTIGFIIHSDGITLSGSLHPTKGFELSGGGSTIERVRDMWINAICDPPTNDYEPRVRNMPIVFKLIESAWNFLKGDKPIWKFDKSFFINDTAKQAWKTVVTMILNSEYTMLHQTLMNDYIAEAKNYFHRVEGNEKYMGPLTHGYFKQFGYDFSSVFVFMLDFFDILKECNKLELLRQIPLDTRSKMIQLFNKVGKHEVVALLNHYHKGDYRSLDTMEGWEL